VGDEILRELDDVRLGDERLEKRARKLLGGFWADPSASINASLHGWSETQAGYRFFDNDKVTPEGILAPHRAATLRRAVEHDVVLFVQDTTELDFTPHAPIGAGPLNSETRLGFLDHTHLAITPERLCLGVLAADVHARSGEGFGEARQRQYDPIETKETYRWLVGYRDACDVAAELPGTRIVSVADAEGDLYELFVEAAERGDAAADFVVRSGKDRSLPEGDTGPEAGPDTYCKLRDAVAEAKVIARRELSLSRTPTRKARVARLELRATRVTLKPPYRKGVKLPPVEVNVVRAQEVDPPPEVDPVEWTLVTSLPIDTAEDVLRVADYYSARWQVEVYFRVLKTGCRVERIQLETADRVRRCLMLYKIVAWRVLYLTLLGRECPELPCDTVFTTDEWQSAWTVEHPHEPLPDICPTLGEFLLLLARLGGHNNRKHDAPPGPESLWRGIRRMTDFAVAWRAFGPPARGYV
jgi:hypothetical protein